MKLFVSAGEPSGDLHGSNFIRAVLSQQPGAQITALGGPLMRAAGAHLLYPLTDLAVMGFSQVLLNLPTFFRVGTLAERHVRAAKPDAVVLIDYPGFHLELARRLRGSGVPVYYFVPPQIWAWKQWRVRAVRKHFTGVLTALPFEEQWYRARHVNTHYIGHPYFDELARQRPDPAFLAAERAGSGTRVALLPGSRNREITANGEMLLSAARKVHAVRPDTRFLVAAFNADHAAAVRASRPAGVPIDVHVGRTPEVIELAEACVAVSGSVGLELMYRAKPAVVVYRVPRVAVWLLRPLIKAKYMSLVNLLAGEELYPEIPTARDESDRIAGHILGWLNDPQSRAGLVAQLETLRDRVAVPGACARAAAYLLGQHEREQRAVA
jgi:lipid-A-disaccharide synthase